MHRILARRFTLYQCLDRDLARRMTTVALSTGLRRRELLGLRWQDVELLDKRLTVRQSFVAR